ncbi:MAG: YeeE/YedE family protein [Candidatus Aminicenantes bacterium]|nr:YeeE/YedE family protein [Candidatus Aminicenantes bacterium]
MDWFEMGRWSPYVVGIGIGILSWLTFILSDKPIGCSTAFARTSGMIERLFRGRKVLEKDYYKQFVPEVDWEWMLVLGIILGSFTSAKISGQFHLNWVPASWAAVFGSQAFTRVVVALVGGIMLGFGARWAGGCTSGHGISGTLQLVVSSWLAAVCFFIGGIAAAFFIFHILG